MAGGTSSLAMASPDMSNASMFFALQGQEYVHPKEKLARFKQATGQTPGAILANNVTQRITQTYTASTLR